MQSNITNEGTFLYDFRAGLVVALVAIPLCLGISLASGAPLLSGLIAGIVGGIVIGALSKSSVSVSGPAAGLAVIVLGAIQTLGNYEVFLTAVCLAGLIQIIMGQAKAGVMAYFIPNSVIKGMLAAIGLLLIIKQFPHAVGYTAGALNHAWYENLHLGAVIISAGSIFFLYLTDFGPLKGNRFFKIIPATLVVVIMGAVVNQLFLSYAPGLAIHTQKLVSLQPVSIGNLGELIRFPEWSALMNWEVWKIAFIIAIIASIETLLCIEATDKLDPYKRVTPTNHELKAQGIGNFLSGLIGGIPITSVIVRSSVNIDNGAKTKLSVIIHGLWLLISLLFLAPFLNLIPLASLAAILIVVGYKLSSIPLLKSVLAKGREQSIPFFTTIISILLTDLLVGIGIGLLVSIGIILKNTYRIQSFQLSQAEMQGDKSIIILSDHVSYLNKASLQNALNQIPSGSEVLIDGTQTKIIDHDIVEILEDFSLKAKNRNIKFKLQTNGNPLNNIYLKKLSSIS